MVKALIFLTAFSQIFLCRFGIEITKEFSLSPSYLFAYLALFVLLLKRFLRFDAFLGLLFLATLLSSCASFLFSTEQKTFTSLFLFWFIYLPFVFVPTNTNNPDKPFSKLYLPMIFVIAVAGIMQFFCQFLFKPEWLFDYRPFLPSYLQNKNTMNTVIPIGGFIKSNGFFLLEPSIFSQWMGLGFLTNYALTGSTLITSVLLLGQTVSFSGTGLILVITFLLTSLHKLNQKQLFFLLLVILLFGIFSYATKDSLLLSRLDEFRGGTGVRTTSAAMRFLNPRFVVAEGLSISPKTFLFGNGPGTYARVTREFEVHDPVWAKVPFEYGVVGAICFFCFLAFSLRTIRFSFPFFLVFLAQFLLCGGHFLTFEVVVIYLVYFKFAIFYS